MATLQNCSILRQPFSCVQCVSGTIFPQNGNFQTVCPVRASLSSSSLSCLVTTRYFRTARKPCRRSLWRAKVGEDEADNTQETSTSEEPKLGEAKGFGPSKALVTEKKKSSKSSSSSSGSIRRSPPSKPLIGAQGPSSQPQQIETAIVTSLAFLFVVILVEGLVLAASGFLPEEYDQFVVNYLYPAFSPTVGVFLVFAAGYGVWKYYGGGTGPSS